jgi:predicted RNase H-like HicB family nuclease
MSLTIETEREADGRWIAEIADLPGVLAYGDDRAEVLRACQSLALRVIADRLEHGEPVPEVVLRAFSPAE